MGNLPPKLLCWIIVVLNCFSSLASTRTTNNATKVLRDLLDPNFYDKRLRPNFEGNPVDVSITVFMTSIGGLDEKEMQFKTTFFLRQEWLDNRLAFKDKYKTKDNMTVGGDIMNQIWKPDTYINNEKSSQAPDNQFKLELFSDGRVLYSQRMTVVASCIMDLRNYPMDKQTCTLLFESYSMTMNDLILHWKGDPFKSAVSIPKAVSMSQFALEEYTVERTISKYITGSFSFLKLNFFIRRKKFYYVIQTYIPTILITILSWVSFWIPRSSPPARVALGITTVLALTTLIFGLQSSMPKVSYVKAIDWFLMVSFTFVFAALIEYPSSTFLKFQAKKIGRSGKTILRKVKGQNHVSSNDLAMNNYAMSSPVEPNEEDENVTKPTRDGKDFPRVQPFSGNTQNGMQHALDYEKGDLRQRKGNDDMHDKKPPSINETFTDGEASNVVDKYAKIVFPLSYFLYNICYWIIYLLEINVVSDS